MSDRQLANRSQPTILAQIILVPLEDEADDIDALSTLEDVRMDIWTEVSTLPGYTVETASDNTRDAGVILILAEVAREAIAQKDLVMVLFQAAVAAIGALAKHGHVKKIEMTLDGDNISVEDADRATVQTLLNIFEAKHPGKVSTVTPSSSIQVRGMVSKTEKTDK
jgi:hypothetical protein